MTTKKYGVIWAPSSNIGDEVQTVAAIEFLRHHGINEYIPINREALNEYDGQPATVIMNGWFIHNLKSFPPSDKISPIFISFHCSKPQLILNNIDYFKKYQPIGCRDTYTVNLFKKNGIDAYFTGCLTLILPKSDSPRKGKLLVDVNNNVPYIPNCNISMSQFSDYEIVTNEIPDLTRKNDFEYKLSCAKILLEKFKNAELVVTSRLHCTLPCRAMGTPVKFIHPNHLRNERFTGLSDILQGSDQLENCNTTIDRQVFKEKVNFFINYKL